MEQDQQDQQKQTKQQKLLFKAARDADYVMGLKSGQLRLLNLLIAHIPHDAPAPISPASGQKLKDKLPVGGRAIRYQVEKLEALGLVENKSLGNGRRHVQRDRTGRIIFIAGIDLSPLLDRASEWAEKAAQKQDAYNERARLRFEISKKRGTLNRLFRTENAPDHLRKFWSDLPANLADLGLAALKALVDKVDELVSAIMADRKNIAGEAAISDRAYTTEQEHSVSCNPTMPAEKQDEERPSRQNPTCGLEHISLKQAMMAAPPDWQVAMEQYGHPSWHALAGVAYERARALEISPTAWSLAQNAVGMNGAAIIVMMADAKSRERGGPIRSVGGWVRRMAERADAGTANLHRTLFGLLHDAKTPC